MMHSSYGLHPTGSLPVPSPYDAMLDDLSSQMTLSQARRLSRSSNGQRSGTAMRVVKPTSANNSPRSSTIMGRRRTLMNDGNAQRRRQQALEQVSTYHDVENNQPAKRNMRPLSWHPSSYGQNLTTQTQQQCYVPMATTYADQRDIYAPYPQISPMLPSYSCNTSPSSSFSPLSLPMSHMDTFEYPTAEEKSFLQQSTSVYPTSTPNPFISEVYPTDNASGGWDWNSFIMHGFNTTTPPTPETFPQTQLVQPAVSEEALPYEALEEPEEEGEILVGMGLYDTPDKYEEDPQLNNYRSTLSSLLGSRFGTQEACGKGLKLEETWEPPKSDDEEDEEDEEESSEEDLK